MYVSYTTVHVASCWHAREEVLSIGYTGENCEAQTNALTYCQFVKTQP
jgi:hypothetical protein